MEKLAKLQGKIISINVEGLGLVFILRFDRQGVILLDGYEGEAHVEISASPVTFLALLFNRYGGSQLPADMKIKGDAALAQSFQQILNKLDIDWEEQLSHLTGDLVARQIGRMVRSLGSGLEAAAESTQQNISEYLLYEKEVIAIQEELDDFIQAVAKLRNDTERLLQRYERLTRNIEVHDSENG